MQREAMEQQKIVEYCDYRNIPIFAIPNGGKRNAKEAYYLKKCGVRAGVPDLCVPVARRGYHGMFIELKVGNNKPTDNQKKWHELLDSNGYLATVRYGAEETIKLIDWYLSAE